MNGSLVIPAAGITAVHFLHGIKRPLEGFNIFNHGNFLGRGQTNYSTIVGGVDTATPLPSFGQLVAPGTATNAIPAFANIDPPRMFQLQARFIF